MMHRSLEFLGQWRTARAGRNVKRAAAVDTVFNHVSYGTQARNISQGKEYKTRHPLTAVAGGYLHVQVWRSSVFSVAL